MATTARRVKHANKRVMRVAELGVAELFIWAFMGHRSLKRVTIKPSAEHGMASNPLEQIRPPPTHVVNRFAAIGLYRFAIT
jgi:hypothetical protein